MRVIVLGDAGNFGARIVRALRGDPTIDLLVAGRRLIAVPGAEDVPCAVVDIAGARLCAAIASIVAGARNSLCWPVSGERAMALRRPHSRAEAVNVPTALMAEYYAQHASAASVELRSMRHHWNATPILAAKAPRFLSTVHSKASRVSSVDASREMSTAPQPRS